MCVDPGFYPADPKNISVPLIRAVVTCYCMLKMLSVGCENCVWPFLLCVCVLNTQNTS